MAASIEYYLKTLASSYYLKNNSAEVTRINSSISNLIYNLNKDLGLRIKKSFVFGSYDRDTILPRRFDSNSDIDLMVIFKHTEFERTPETYRSWLKNFADKHYKNRYGSEVLNTFPTVTIRLNNIHYDLVPAKEETYWFSNTGTIYIPANGGWQATNPNDVKEKLTKVNTQYNYIVRPIIRILKAWNCSNDYPFDSYLLELKITDMYFYGHTVQSGLFYAVKQLNSGYGDSLKKITKIQSLKNNFALAEKALNENNVVSAKLWLHKVLPIP